MFAIRYRQGTKNTYLAGALFCSLSRSLTVDGHNCIFSDGECTSFKHAPADNDFNSRQFPQSRLPNRKMIALKSVEGSANPAPLHRIRMHTALVTAPLIQYQKYCSSERSFPPLIARLAAVSVFCPGTPHELAILYNAATSVRVNSEVLLMPWVQQFSLDDV